MEYLSLYPPSLFLHLVQLDIVTQITVNGILRDKSFRGKLHIREREGGGGELGVGALDSCLGIGVPLGV